MRIIRFAKFSLNTVLVLLQELRVGAEDHAVAYPIVHQRGESSVYAHLNKDDCVEAARLVFGAAYLRLGARCTGMYCQGIAWKNNGMSSIVPSGSVNSRRMTCREAMFFNIQKSYETFSTTTLQERPLQIDISLGTAGKTVNLYLGSNKDDHRARVNVVFQYKLSGRPFSLMFDTGAHSTFIEVGKCDFGDYTGPNGMMEFGTKSMPQRINSGKSVQETASIEGFTFPLKVSLVEECRNAFGGGLLGASRQSDFTNAAKIFAYLPSQSSSATAGSLLIGDIHRWAAYCKGSIQPLYFQVKNSVSQFHWILDGAAFSMSSDGSVVKGIRVNWLVDTGAAFAAVPPALYDVIIQMIRKTGSDVIQIGNSKVFPSISKCDENQYSFPKIFLRVGDKQRKYEVELHPTDYTTKPVFRQGGCQLLLNKSTVSIGENTVLLGEPFLRRSFTIFDSIRDTVGLCSPRT